MQHPFFSVTRAGALHRALAHRLAVAPVAVSVRWGSSKPSNATDSDTTSKGVQGAMTWRTKLDNFTNFRRQTFRSSDARGPQHGVGFDPVLNHHLFQQATGPLRRKRNSVTRPEDCFSLEEQERWMEAKQAAKVLQLKEEDLATLNKEALEIRWAELYRQPHHTALQREEILLATEVLLEFLDSSGHQKRHRLYYHQLLDNARIAIDLELESEKRKNQEQWMWLAGFGSLAACVVVMGVAVLKGTIQIDDVKSIGRNAGQYLTMSFLQPKNFEPPPDYSTRYFATPTALESDLQEASAAGETEEESAGATTGPSYHRSAAGSPTTTVNQEPPNRSEVEKEQRRRTAAVGTSSLLWEKEAEVSLRKEKLEQDRAEAHEMLQMLNDAKELALHPAPHADRDARTSSDVGSSLSREEKPGETSALHPKSFTAFAAMMASNFGGGSRFQRMGAETTKRLELEQETNDRVKRFQTPAGHVSRQETAEAS